MALRTSAVNYGKMIRDTCLKNFPSLLRSPSRIFSSSKSISVLAAIPQHKNELTNDKNITKNSFAEFNGDKISFSGSLLKIDQLIPSPLIVSVRHYESVKRPRLHCKGCYFVRRHGRKFVECSDVPSHKQMKKVATRFVWLEDYTRGSVNNGMKWNRDLTRIADRHVDRTVVSHNWFASRIGKGV